MLQDQILMNHAKKKSQNFYAYEILVKASIFSTFLSIFLRKYILAGNSSCFKIKFQRIMIRKQSKLLCLWNTVKALDVGSVNSLNYQID
jgi:hypothetical protein